MITESMAGVVVRRDGKLLTVLGTADRDGETVLHIQGAAVDFWGSPRELYRRGYRLIIAKLPVWVLWGREVCAADLGERSSLVQ